VPERARLGLDHDGAGACEDEREGSNRFRNQDSSRSELSADDLAPPLEQEHVAPDAVELAEPFAPADDFEADALV
jgi:hypothetical protein